MSLQRTASSVVTGTSGFRGREFSFRLLREERRLAVRRCGGLGPAGCVCSGGPLSFLDCQHRLIPDLLEKSAPLEGNDGTAFESGAESVLTRVGLDRFRSSKRKGLK